MKRILHHFKTSVEKSWYGPLLAFLAALDYFVMIIPTDGLLITSSIAAPRRWIKFSLWLAIGSVAGGIAFAALVQLYGNDFLEWVFPSIHQNQLWKISDEWINKYGVWAIFFVTALPVISHPVIAIAALMNTPLQNIAWTLLIARTLKYTAFSWLASHAPHYLLRSKALRREVAQAEKEYMDE